MDSPPCVVFKISREAWAAGSLERAARGVRCHVKEDKI